MTRPIASSTLVTTDTGETSLIVGGTPGGSTGTGGQVTGPIAINSRVPADSSYKLYNNAGTLTWNGIVVATGSSVSGTTGKLSKFTAANALGDSIVAESGAVATVTGTVNATAGIQLNGTSINTGATLSNVAYLDQSQTFSNASGQKFSAGIAIDGGTQSTHGIVMPSAVPGNTATNLYNTGGTLTWKGDIADNIGTMAAIRSSIAMVLIGSAHGTVVSGAGTTNVGNFAISGLSLYDNLYVLLNHDSTGAAGGVTLYNVSDSVTVATMSSVNTTYYSDVAWIGADPNNSVKVYATAMTANNPAIQPTRVTFTTAWTGAWTLAARIATPAADWHYTISVYKIAS